MSPRAKHQGREWWPVCGSQGQGMVVVWADMLLRGLER